MELDQFLHQRQADAGAFVRAAAALFNPMEALEHARQFLGRNAHPGVANSQARAALRLFPAALRSRPRSVNLKALLSRLRTIFSHISRST